MNLLPCVARNLLRRLAVENNNDDRDSQRSFHSQRKERLLQRFISSLHLAFARRSRDQPQVAITGTTIRMAKGVVIMPPTTTRASGCCACTPMPCESAAGSSPRPAARQAISTARISPTLARMMECFTPCSCASARRMPATKTNPPSVATPITDAKPTAAEMLKGVREMQKRQNTAGDAERQNRQHSQRIADGIERDVKQDRESCPR